MKKKTPRKKTKLDHIFTMASSDDPFRSNIEDECPNGLKYYSDYEVDPGVYVADDDSNEPDTGLAYQYSPGITAKTSSLGEKPSNKLIKKLKSSKFLDETRNMTDGEFIENLFNETHIDVTFDTVCDLYGNKFTPDPNQTINYITGVILGNPKYMERFIIEVKRRNGLQEIIDCMMSHKEAHDSIVNSMDDPVKGKENADQFMDAVNRNYIGKLDNFEAEVEEDYDEEGLGESSGPSFMKKRMKKYMKGGASNAIFESAAKFHHFKEMMRKYCS